GPTRPALGKCRATSLARASLRRLHGAAQTRVPSLDRALDVAPLVEELDPAVAGAPGLRGGRGGGAMLTVRVDPEQEGIVSPAHEITRHSGRAGRRGLPAGSEPARSDRLVVR